MSGIDGVSASAMQQAGVRAEISFAVAAKQLDAQKQMGEAALQLLESAVQMVKEAGKGDQFDSTA